MDETGFVLITANELRLIDAHPGHLSRSRAVDWAALLGIMVAAAENQRDPFQDAVQAQERLFTTKRSCWVSKNPCGTRMLRAGCVPIPNARGMCASGFEKCSTARGSGNRFGKRSPAAQGDSHSGSAGRLRAVGHVGSAC